MLKQERKTNSTSELLSAPLDLYGRDGADTSIKGSNYIWLAYSIFFFIEPVMSHSVRYRIIQGAIYLVFLALYVDLCEYVPAGYTACDSGRLFRHRREYDSLQRGWLVLLHLRACDAAVLR